MMNQDNLIQSWASFLNAMLAGSRMVILDVHEFMFDEKKYVMSTLASLDSLHGCYIGGKTQIMKSLTTGCHGNDELLNFNP